LLVETVGECPCLLHARRIAVALRHRDCDGARLGPWCLCRIGERQRGIKRPVATVATRVTVWRIRATNHHRCRTAHKPSAIRLPPGTRSSIAPYGPILRISLASPPIRWMRGSFMPPAKSCVR
jgi:hypothetical protein